MSAPFSHIGPNACPDEEGIKTVLLANIGKPQRPNACPDEEGIKTGLPRGAFRAVGVRTLALTKKGLRLEEVGHRHVVLGPNACPDEEGIKTWE